MIASPGSPYMMRHYLLITAAFLVPNVLLAGTTTWDGKYTTQKIELSVVYFVPSDRSPLADWRERVDYYCQRIEKFHTREFGSQSTLTTKVIEEPIISSLSTKSLRNGDANSIYFKTLSEVDRAIQFQDKRKEGTFPILLVLSEINWRPLDDFYRLRPGEDRYEFEGNYQRGEHFPGATSGGARASYLSDRGCGWGLVSADGWRVPYRGSDCVVYHEGCGHTVGLPHPDQPNGSVMSLGQYRGWISESWLDKDQKAKLNWHGETENRAEPTDLFSTFRAIPTPRVPQPNQPVTLTLNWPTNANVKKLRVRYQTSIEGPWCEIPQTWSGKSPEMVNLGIFDRDTPISYRIDTELESGETEELWGYLQVREDETTPPFPVTPSVDLLPSSRNSIIEIQPIDPSQTINLLELTQLHESWKTGEWIIDNGEIISPKGYGARMELPQTPSGPYQIQLLVEPLDPPNALLIGNQVNSNRFATLFGFATAGGHKSAIENIDGRNVGNETTFTGNLFRTNQIAQVIVQVNTDRVTMLVDGVTIVDWKGDTKQLSLSDYWNTPNPASLFLGTYDCRFRFHQILLTPL
jgi:hypothetical protein